MCDAIAYVARNGIEWRALPVDFPPWEAVYAFYQRWNARGLPQALAARLRENLREHQGRAAQPTACIVDSQIVKCADTVPAASRGYHGGKKITGRGRHAAVDVGGWLLALVVTAASVSDKAGLKLLVIRLFNAIGTLQIMWADSGYDGNPVAAFVKTAAAITLEVVKRTSPHSFQVVRRRWVVETSKPQCCHNRGWPASLRAPSCSVPVSAAWFFSQGRRLCWPRGTWCRVRSRSTSAGSARTTVRWMAGCR
jgi:transposase